MDLTDVIRAVPRDGADRIAIFHATLPEPGRKVGGVEMTVHRLANALVRFRQLDITVFSCGNAPPDALYTHITLRPAWRLGGRLRRLTLLPLALNFVDFSGFDLLHLHGDDWFFVRRRIPTVRTLHGSALEEARFATNAKRKMLQSMIYPLEHLSARLATRVLAVGPETRATFKADGLADNGVDTTLFRPRGEKHERPLLFYVGSWDGRKRGRFAFETFLRNVLPAMPDAQLYMACNYVPRHPSVIDGRYPEDRELACWLARAWVFFYPSTYEGFGIPYLEALASGTPVVTTPNGGADYVLDRGRFGDICEDMEFGQRTVALLQDAARRSALAQSGRQRALGFSWDLVAARHAEVYRALLAGRLALA